MWYLNVKRISAKSFPSILTFILRAEIVIIETVLWDLWQSIFNLLTAQIKSADDKTRLKFS